jgi:hypothetical protein
VAVLLVTLVSIVAPSAPPATAAASDSPDWVPFVGSNQIWCTMSNPGWSGCQGHHSSPAIDIGMPVGTIVTAAGPGVVHAREVNDVGAAGKYVAVAHPDGTYSRYLHLSQVDVTVGQTVARGQQMGRSGVTGSATSPHLHYDEQKPYGTRIDPGPMYGLVNGSLVTYPAAFGQGSWWTVPYGSILRNDDYPGIFLDVADDHAFATEIVWAVDHGITQGYTDGTFRPTEPVERQAMVAFLYRLSGSPPGPFVDPGYTDVGPGHPFAIEIAWAAATGVTGGFSDGTFRPTNLVNRSSAAAFFHRLAGAPPGPFVDPGYADVPVGHPFQNEIWWMATSGITGGYGDGTYRPGEPVTRQSATAFVYRYAT